MNGEGKSILEFSEALDLSIANTWFKKREEHLITYKSGGTCSQIDFFLIRKSDRKYCLNCKVISGESLTTQHRVLVMDVRIRDRAKRRSPMVAPRIKWWHLKGEKQGIFQQKIWEGWCGQSQGSANDMWNKMSQEIIKVAKETLGESRGFGPRGKESWWWNENVQSKVRVKNECFKEWSRCRNSETWDKYKIARNETKKTVSEARAQAFDGLYKALGTRDGERSIYRLAKGRERKTRDLDQVKCVKDEEGKVLVHEKDIKERWKAYFHNLFNDGYGYDSSSLDTREEDRNYKYYRRIQKQEVKEVLKRMSNGKAVGPDNIPIEVWKTLGDRGLEWLTELFNEIMRSKRMPEEWRRSTLVPIYKNKGDIQNCANYRGIKLMSHTMKLWERVIERRLRKETQVTENQFGFMPGRSTMEAIYLLRRVMEQYRMAQQDLHLIFIDLEKAYDRVPREILWKALEKKGVRVAYIRAIQDMYDRVSTSVRTQGGESDDFPITIGLHQGSTLSPYLFTLILDVLTEQIQEIAPRCMLFADDIVLLGESREELNERLETWRRALETHGFRLSRSKSEYMECKFNKRRRVSNSEVKIGDHIIPQVTRFKYLGSVIQDDGEIEGDVNHRIQAGWMKWRKASGVLCDAKVPIKLKGKFYRTAVRPAILYGTECWAVKSQHENKVGVAEMRMLRWMCGKTRQDKIRNEAIRERVGVAPIVEKMVENRLRWFGHVERRPIDSVVRRVDQMERRQTIRGRGIPKKTIREVIKKDLELNDLDRSMDNLSFPLICPDWNADEEMLLLEDLSHVMGKSKEELFAMMTGHEAKKEFSLTTELTLKEEPPFADGINYEESKKEEINNQTMSRLTSACGKAYSSTVKKASSVIQNNGVKVEVESHADRNIGQKKLKLSGEDRPSMTDLSGYSFKQEEFDVEYDNDAEQVLAVMEFKDTDTEAEYEMKLQVLHIYSKSFTKTVLGFCGKRESYGVKGISLSSDMFLQFPTIWWAAGKRKGFERRRGKTKMRERRDTRVHTSNEGATQQLYLRNGVPMLDFQPKAPPPHHRPCDSETRKGTTAMNGQRLGHAALVRTHNSNKGNQERTGTNESFCIFWAP
ncbi:Transcriptional adapter ADA2a [Glycine soja]